MIDPSELELLMQAKRQSLEAIDWLDRKAGDGTPEEEDWKAAMRANQASLLAIIEQVIAPYEEGDDKET